jgi:hypothetical protein
MVEIHTLNNEFLQDKIEGINGEYSCQLASNDLLLPQH